MSHAPGAGSPAHDENIIQQLHEGWRPLPTKTVFALALGGLRVRMMRSVVTMLSVVLAIAFLAYSGIANQLTTRLAQVSLDLYEFEPMSPERVEAAASEVLAFDLIGTMTQAEQGKLARRLGMHRYAEQEAELDKLGRNLIAATVTLTTAQQRLAEALADPDAIDTDPDVARREADAAQAEVVRIETRQAALRDHIDLARWLERGEVENGDEAALRARLVGRLRETKADAIDGLRQAAHLGAPQIALAARFVALCDAAGAGQPARELDELLSLDRRRRDARSLDSLLRRQGVNPRKQVEQGNPMDTWLIIMALVTCTVGIANAMLMSVTERFREIGTMKCLGAQDGLVVKLFLLESSFLGITGAAIGIVVGMLVGVLAAVLQFRSFGLTYFPLAESWRVILWSVVGGILLAVIGAVYPAFAASRMKPVDALRVDE